MRHNSNETIENFDLVVAQTLSELRNYPRTRLGRVDLTTVDVDDITVFDPHWGSSLAGSHVRR